MKNNKIMLLISGGVAMLLLCGLAANYAVRSSSSQSESQVKQVEQSSPGFSSVSEATVTNSSQDTSEEADSMDSMDSTDLVGPKISKPAEAAGPSQPTPTLIPTAEPTAESTVEPATEKEAEATAEPTVTVEQENLTPTPEITEGAQDPEASSHKSVFTEETNSDPALTELLSQVEERLPQNNGSWAVYISDLSKGTEADLNAQPMQAASLIKLFIMGAVYENYDALCQQYGQDAMYSSLYSMITVSDNDSANALVSRLGNGDSASGMQKVNAFCQAHGYTSTSMGRLLLQSNEFGDNYTSVSDCGKLLKEIYQLVNGVSDPSAATELSHAQDMFQLLSQQTRRNKIPANMPEDVQVANKTGELADVENDAAIITSDSGVNLVICFMSEDLSQTGEAQNVIAQESRAIYDYYKQ